MPSQINFNITGRLGNVIFYKLYDKYYARSVPARVKQTKATKARATEFGKASKAGKALRQQLLPVIPFPADNNMQTRLVSALFKWLKLNSAAPLKPDNSLPFINSFQFTNGATLQERWKVSLTVSKPSAGLLELAIPAFEPGKSIQAPAGTVSVECKMAAAGCMIDSGVSTGSFATTLLFDYNNTNVPARVILMPLPTPKGCIVAVAISLIYNISKKGQVQKTTNAAFMPAGMVSGMYV